MERKVKNDGRFFECDAEDLSSQIPAAQECHVLALNVLRMEFAADEKRALVHKFSKFCEMLEPEMEGMDERQKSTFVFRHMILKDGMPD